MRQGSRALYGVSMILFRLFLCVCVCVCVFVCGWVCEILCVPEAHEVDLLANADIDAPQGLHDGLDGAPRVLVLIHERALPLGEILRGHGPVKGPQHACPRKVQAPCRVARVRGELHRY